MIIQALTEYYRTLEGQGKIASPGWGPAKVSFALILGADGTLRQVIPVQTQQMRGKNKVFAPQVMSLPAQVKRTVGVAANFLCDNASYILGDDDKGKPERSRQCFAACKALHGQVLEGVNSAAARAVLGFFRLWRPENARSNPVLAEHLKDILSGGNLVFRTAEGFVHNDPAVRRAWETYYSAAGDGPRGICLATGAWGPVEAVHPAIKNVVGAQSSGAALVSFNAVSLCSYGKEQSLNAPTGKYAAFAYTAALNHLLADRERVYRVGDATVVGWASSGSSGYPLLFKWSVMGPADPDGAGPSYTQADLRGMVKRLCQGEMIEFQAERLDPKMDFYVLGLSPNAARLSVRFFLRNTFGGFLRNVQEHQQRLQIVRPAFDPFEDIPLWKLLSETVNPNARDKTPDPHLAGAVLRTILTGTRYPATLLNGATLRIRAQREITRGRAAILKAYYLQNPHPDVPKEVLTVALNDETANIPYTLGRIFSLLEAVQLQANPGINASIKDKYFNSAAATPAVVFPLLTNLAQKHLKKLRSANPSLAISYDKQLTQLLTRIGESYPAHMSLPQQGSFQLGYYWTAKLYAEYRTPGAVIP